MASFWGRGTEYTNSSKYLILKYFTVLESCNCVRLASNYKWKVFFLRSVNVFATELNSYLLNTVSMLVCKLLTLNAKVKPLKMNVLIYYFQ